MLHSPLIVSFVRSLIMHRLVSKETRTVASKGIWKATRMYCVRIVGTWRDEYGRKRSCYRIGGVLLWLVVTLQCVSLECHEKWGVHIGDVMWCGVVWEQCVTSCLLLMACTTSEASVCHSLISSSLLPVCGVERRGEERNSQETLSRLIGR